MILGLFLDYSWIIPGLFLDYSWNFILDCWAAFCPYALVGAYGKPNVYTPCQQGKEGAAWDMTPLYTRMLKTGFSV